MGAGKSKWVLMLLLAVTLAVPFIWRPAKDATDGLPHQQPGTDALRLTLISPHWEGVRSEFGRAFSEWTLRERGHLTELEWIDVGGTSDSVRFVQSEFSRSPAGIGIDLFFGGGVDPFMQMADLGLLMPCTIPDHILKVIPATFAGIEVYDPERRWFGAALAGFGILYNKGVCKTLGIPEPRTWADLGTPAYRTWVGAGDLRSSGSVHMAYEIMLQAYGWEEGWAVITRMSANARNFSRASSEVTKNTAIGEVAAGMAIDVYGWRQVAEVGADRMGFVLPDALTTINPDSIAVLKGAPQAELAQAFVAFVLSEEGQKLWCLKKGVPGGPREFELDRMPVIPGLATRYADTAAVPFDPYAWTPGFLYDADKGSRRWAIVNDLIGATMIDTHAELAAAWKVALASGDTRIAEALVQPPLTEEALMDMVEQWKDPEFRAKQGSKWASEARTRYRRLARTPAHRREDRSM